MPISSAIKKYQWENFEVSILEEPTPELLDKRETFWITSLNTLSPNGYNLTMGGEGTTGFKHRQETKDHMKIVMIGKNKGKKHPHARTTRCGQHNSDEHNSKISAAMKGRKPSKYTIQRVKETNTGKIPWNKGLKLKPK
jgi:group I intron endonuclease